MRVAGAICCLLVACAPFAAVEGDAGVAAPIDGGRGVDDAGRVDADGGDEPFCARARVCDQFERTVPLGVPWTKQEILPSTSKLGIAQQNGGGALKSELSTGFVSTGSRFAAVLLHESLLLTDDTTIELTAQATSGSGIPQLQNPVDLAFLRCTVQNREVRLGLQIATSGIVLFASNGSDTSASEFAASFGSPHRFRVALRKSGAIEVDVDGAIVQAPNADVAVLLSSSLCSFQIGLDAKSPTNLTAFVDDVRIR